MNKKIYYWLLTGCLMIIIMVVIGGITRLTHSGLSITEWKPITGAIPPLNETQWLEEFEKYKQIPEYELKHSHMGLADFKYIYFWEFIHRQWGRFMGVVFLIPFLYFVFTKQLHGALLKKSIIILIGGGSVGALGWFMVASGLSERPDVSHYRLAIHLAAAFSLCMFIFYTALGMKFTNLRAPVFRSFKLEGIAGWILALAALQIIYGAFVAGLRAGTVHTTFPLMTGNLVPHDFMYLHGNLLDFLEHKSTVQFIHRVLGFSLTGLVLFFWINAEKNKRLPADVKTAARIVAAVITIQFIVGAFTVVYAVPITLGVIHQLIALLFLLSWVYYYRVSRFS